MQLAVLLDQGKKLLFLNLVYFIQEKKYRTCGFPDDFEHLFIGGVELFAGIHHPQDEIAALKGIVDLAHHPAT